MKFHNRFVFAILFTALAACEKHRLWERSFYSGIWEIALDIESAF